MASYNSRQHHTFDNKLFCFTFIKACMNRFKFRIWSIDKNKMYYDYIIFPDKVVVIEHDKDKKSEISELTENYIIQQTTGLFDKDKNEIFEGDLVIRYCDTVYEIRYCEAYSGYMFCLFNIEDDDIDDFYGGMRSDVLKIVGNKYQYKK